MNDPYFEKDASLEALRSRLAQAGCTIDRQWGGRPVFAIYLPPPHDPPCVVVARHYADFPDRAAARRSGYLKALEWMETRAHRSSAGEPQ